MTIARFTAGGDIAQGAAVYVAPGGVIYTASAKTVQTASVVGVAMEAGYLGTVVPVNLDAVYTDYSNLIPGKPLYLSIASSGVLVSSSGWLEEFASYSGDAYQTFMGRCVSTSGLSIEISPPVLIAYSG
jgi:hypothetical protein